jgi:hypothetical protein
MSDPVLFDVPPVLFDVPPRNVTDFCRTCAFRTAYHYDHTVISYCQKQRSNRTENGFKKIKSKDPACPQHERDAPKHLKAV